MYTGGQVLGASTTTTGALLLPNTGSSRPLFVAAIAILAFGIVTLVASSVTAYRQSHSRV